MAIKGNISILGNSISIFAIRFCLQIISLFGYVYYSQNLTQSQNGKYSVIFLLSLPILITIGSLGIGNVIFNFSASGFIQFLKALSKKVASLYLVFVITICFMCVWILEFREVIDAQEIIDLILFFVLNIVSFWLDNILLIFKKFKKLLLITFCSSLFIIVGHIFALNNDGTFDLLKLTHIWSAILFIKIILLSIIIFNSVIGYKITVDQNNYRPQGFTWFHLGFYEIGQNLIRYLDKVIIAFITTQEALAIYLNGRYEIPLLPALLSSVRSAALLKLTDSGRSKLRMIQVIQFYFKILSFAILAITIFGIIYRTEIITVVLGEKYDASIPYFLITLLMLPAQYCIAITFIHQFENHASIINKGLILEFVLMMLFIYPLYILFSSLGIALSLLISTYVQSLYYLFQTKKIVGVSIRTLIPIRFYFNLILIYSIVAVGSHLLFSWIFAPSFTLIFGTITGICTLFILYKKINFSVESYDLKDE